MAVGSSGRVVIDLDPQVKRQLHAALVADGLTLKEWFQRKCERYLQERGQPSLFAESTDDGEGDE